MELMKKLSSFIVLSFFILISCNDSSTNKTVDEDDNNMTETVEDKAMKAITNLPEYHDAADIVSAMTNGEQSLSSIIETPNEDHSEFYIQVGYNQETWFETYYFFYVNPETFEVFIEDIVEGDVISIETWRIREKNR